MRHADGGFVLDVDVGHFWGQSGGELGFIGSGVSRSGVACGSASLSVAA